MHQQSGWTSSPSRLIGAPTSAIPPFLCRMPFLTQPSQFILAWDRHQICWLAYPVAWFIRSYQLSEIVISSAWQSIILVTCDSAAGTCRTVSRQMTSGDVTVHTSWKAGVQTDVHRLDSVVVDGNECPFATCKGDLSLTVWPPVSQCSTVSRRAPFDHCLDDWPTMFTDPVTKTLLRCAVHLHVRYCLIWLLWRTNIVITVHISRGTWRTSRLFFDNSNLMGLTLDSSSLSIHPTFTEALLTFKMLFSTSFWITANILTLNSPGPNSCSSGSKSNLLKYTTPR